MFSNSNIKLKNKKALIVVISELSLCFFTIVHQDYCDLL